MRLSFLARFFISNTIFRNYIWRINSLGGNPTKWSNTLKEFVGNLPRNCLSVFDHFVGLALNGLKRCMLSSYLSLDTNDSTSWQAEPKHIESNYSLLEKSFTFTYTCGESDVFYQKNTVFGCFKTHVNSYLDQLFLPMVSYHILLKLSISVNLKFSVLI